MTFHSSTPTKALSDESVLASEFHHTALQEGSISLRLTGDLIQDTVL